MPLTVGTRVGHYEILSALGAGGMGEVYRARDTKLGRDVAIKILPDAFTRNPERLARFEREARLLAALNHPNIATIHGLEDADGVHALVLELIDGDTLADRISRGPIPPDAAVAMAIQIADALDAAHQKGIVHRDIKPSNIKITIDGAVKVLDFGLAVAVSEAGSESPTATSARTREGTILGTAAYMSPEQARGQAVDERTDLWAFGCVLYEMLTRRSPFVGSTVSDTLARVLEREPDWSALPATTSPSIRRLLLRCLTKDPKHRLRDIGDARLDLIDSSSESPAATAARRDTRREYLGWSVAAALMVAAAATWLGRTRETATPAPIARTTLLLAEDQSLATGDVAYPIALSRDGSRLAYVGEKEGRTLLYIRDLSALEPREIPGTADAMQPFFSPDGQWVGFFAGGALQKVAVAGGAPLRIANLSGFAIGGSWADDDTIVFALRGIGLSRIKGSGGAIERIMDAPMAAWPEVLPGTKTVLYTTDVAGARDSSAIAAVSLDGRDQRIVAGMAGSALEGPRMLGTGGGISQARFVSSGFLIYGQSPGIVRALPIDLPSLAPTGSPIPLIDSVEQARNGGAVYFAVSPNGLMVYASTGEQHQLVWVDRQGAVTPISADRAAFRNARLSPDDTRIAVAINDETRRSDIWIYDAATGARTRMTTSEHNLNPVWSPDGERITFAPGGLVELPIDGSGARTVLLSREQARALLAKGTNPYATSWSPDGRHLLFQADERDLWTLDRGNQSDVHPLLARAADDYHGVFSPDGQWVAYVSNETGRPEIYVGRWPDLSGRITASINGGTFPRWSKDGRELFYRQGDAVMSVTIETKPILRTQAPRRLFAGPFSGAGRERGFDVTRDGRRFVMVKSDVRSSLRQLTLVQNWFESLKSPYTVSQ
jgi:Tol biopolymer transport system component